MSSVRTPPKGRPDPSRREPLWDRVDKNRLRLLWYLALFFAVSGVWTAFWTWVTFKLMALVVPEIGGTVLVQPWFGALIGAALSLLYVFTTLMRSERRLIERLDAVIVPKGELLESKMALKDMAIAAGMETAPAFYYVPTDNTNAFVFDAMGRRPILGVSQGFVERLSIDEQRAVFANLMARLVAGDIMVASAMTALLAPLQAWRDRRIERLDGDFEMLAAAGERSRYGDDPRYVRTSEHASPDALLLILPFGIALVILGELLAAAHRSSQLTAAEKADAEGMLLLKDPQSMLSALQRCIELDNVVPQAGESLGELFYCWTGDSTNDEDDPEWVRVARLREVLGVEGHVPPDDLIEQMVVAPPPPRVTEETP